MKDNIERLEELKEERLRKATALIGHDPWFLAPCSLEFLGDNTLLYINGINQDGIPFLVFPSEGGIHKRLGTDREGDIINPEGIAFKYHQDIPNHPTRPHSCSTDKHPPKMVAQYLRSPKHDTQES